MKRRKREARADGGISLRQLLLAAHRQHQAGKLREAAAGYRQVLMRDPRQIDALRLLGVAEAQLGNLVAARETFESATRQAPKDAESHCNLGRLLLEMGECEEARSSLEQARSLRRDHTDTHLHLGLCLKELGDAAGAEREFRHALGLKRDHPVVLNNLGALLLEREETGEAIALLESATSHAPRYAQAHYNLGKAYRHAGKLDAAEAAYRKAIEIEPKFAEPLVGLANLKTDRGDFEDALVLNEQALRLSPQPCRAAKIRYNVSRLYQRLLRPQDGLTELNRVLKVQPNDVEARILFARLLTDLGRIDEAEGILLEVLRDSPVNAMACLALAELGTFARKDVDTDGLIAAMRRKLETHDPDTEARARLHFALARALHDTGDAEAAFEYLHKGNALKFQSLPYNADAHARACTVALERFSVPPDRPAADDSGPIPIFVVGIPRSGTTLIEQILAAHPDVASCGELDFIDSLRPRADFAAGENLDGYRSIGKAYLDRVQGRFAPRTRYITDKTPFNFSHIGWLRQALPAARIVNCRRAPMDTAFACYQCLFQNTLPWSYDFEALAHYYGNYERVMAAWHAAFPGEIFDVSYEELVAEPEPAVRDLLNFCGLPWDERCLSFYDNANPVTTASNAQVRRPIYRSSVGKWRRYEAYLGPLQQAMARNGISV